MLAMLLALALAMGSLAASQNTTASVANVTTPCIGSPDCQVKFNMTDKPVEKLNVTTPVIVPLETTPEANEVLSSSTTSVTDPPATKSEALEAVSSSTTAVLVPPQSTPEVKEVSSSSTTVVTAPAQTTPEAGEVPSSSTPSVSVPPKTEEVLPSTTPGTVPPKTEAAINIERCLEGQDCDLANALQEKSFVLGTIESKQWKQVLAMRLYALLLKKNTPFPGHINKLFPGRSAESESNTIEERTELPTIKTPRKSTKMRRRHHGHKKRRHRKRNRKAHHRTRGSLHSNTHHNNRSNRHRKVRSVSPSLPTSLGDTPGWINIFSHEITKQHRGSNKRKAGRRNRQRQYRLNRKGRKGRKFPDASVEDNGDVPVPKPQIAADIDIGVPKPPSDSRQLNNLTATGKEISQSESRSSDTQTQDHKTKGRQDRLSDAFPPGERDYGVNEIITTRLGKNAGQKKSWRTSTASKPKRNRSSRLSRRRRKFRDRQPFLRWRWPRRVLPRALRRRKGRTAVQV